MTNSIGITLVAAGLIGLGACGGGMSTTQGGGEPVPSLQDVSAEQWARLAQRRVFFGHQSVGGNIMAGVTEVLARNPQIRLNVVESRDLASASQPGLVHAPVGRNDYPLEKFDDFVAISSAGFGADGGVAMVKLCYTDVHKDTDARALFEDYQKRIAALKARNPSLTIVHFTMPLTGIENWKGRVRAALTGNATQRDRNFVRQQYNELVRQAYAGKEPLFDIARLESTLPDGMRVSFRSRGEDVPLLAPSYTDDGGHLNAEARRRVGEQFLIMLARLQPAPAAAPAATRSAS
jgi:hypothetical protein